MMRPGRIKWMLSAAVSAALVASFASAQQQVDNGRVLDANNRVGSGGFNSGPIRPYDLGSGNRIVTGNVTGGKEFRGDVPYTDPREFRGGVAGSQFDRFIAGSAAAPAPNQVPIIPGRSEPFYGRALAGPLPAGFSQQGFSGTYTPAPLTPRELRSSGLGPAAAPLDVSMRLPVPEDLVLSGPIDPATNRATLLVGSPLMGVRAWDPGEVNDRQFLSTFTSLRQDGALDRLRLDPATIQRMRDQLNRGGEPSSDAGRPEDAAPMLSRPMPTPVDAPDAQALTQKPLGTELTASPLGNVRPGYYDRPLAPVAQQSSQYAELERRLGGYYLNRLQTDEDRNREVLAQLRLRQAQARTAEQFDPTAAPRIRQPDEPALPPDMKVPDARRPDVKPGDPGFDIPDYAAISRELLKEPAQIEPDVTTDPRPSPRRVARPAPLKIDSLARGVQAEGLRKLLTDAEDLMRQGKFVSALDQYVAAEAVAPNNELVVLGKAHAELGAGYYRKAEAHIRQALTADPVLLMARFDLAAMMGEQRLPVVVRDLKETARQQEKDAGVVLLLAYMSYNLSQNEQAQAYLDEASRRAGGQDEFYRLLRTHWLIGPPATQPSGEDAMNQ